MLRPGPMRRVLVIGCSGAGKSTLSRKLAAALGLPLVPLDRAYWRPGWVQPTKDEWRRIVEALVAEPAWVMDGNYSGTFDLRMLRADTAIWLDYPRTRCLWRVIMRSVKDFGRTRADLADGCPEKFDPKFWLFIWDFPNRSRPLIFEGLRTIGSHLRVIRLTNDREVAAFLRASEAA
jgi:adenylate kinase family enzyme